MGANSMFDLAILFMTQLIHVIPQFIALTFAFNLLHYFFYGRD